MRPSQITAALHTCIKAKRPVMLSGSPGVGKSQVVFQVAESLGLQVIDLRLSQLDPVDLRGVPSVNARTKRTIWNSPEFFPDSGKGILFFDEINSAPQATQASAYQLILDRKIGERELPPGWSMVAAGNLFTDNAIVNRMSSALKNRLIHLNFEVNLEDWSMWALTHNIAPEVLGFIRFRPSLLNEFEKKSNKDDEKNRIARLKDGNAFATPRTWEFMSQLFAHGGVDPAIEYELYSGVVGEGPAAEFAAYMKYHRSLPKLETILMNPDKVKVPEEPATLYALATGLATVATEANFKNVLRYAKRMPPEFSVLLVKDAVVRDESLTNTIDFGVWATENGKFMN